MLGKIKRFVMLQDTLILIGIVLFLLICYVLISQYLNVELYKDIVLGVVSGIASSIVAYLFYSSIEESRRKKKRKYKELYANLILQNLYNEFPWSFPYFSLKFSDLTAGKVKDHHFDFYGFVLAPKNLHKIDEELKRLEPQNIDNMRNKLAEMTATLASTMRTLHDEEKLAKVDSLLTIMTRFSNDLYLFKLTRGSGVMEGSQFGSSFVSITSLVHQLGLAAEKDRKGVKEEMHSQSHQ